MANNVINTRIQLKVDTLTNWQTNNPVLLNWEIAIAIHNLLWQNTKALCVGVWIFRPVPDDRPVGGEDDAPRRIN